MHNLWHHVVWELLLAQYATYTCVVWKASSAHNVHWLNSIVKRETFFYPTDQLLTLEIFVLVIFVRNTTCSPDFLLFIKTLSLEPLEHLE